MARAIDRALLARVLNVGLSGDENGPDVLLDGDRSHDTLEPLDGSDGCLWASGDYDGADALAVALDEGGRLFEVNAGGPHMPDALRLWIVCAGSDAGDDHALQGAEEYIDAAYRGVFVSLVLDHDYDCDAGEDCQCEERTRATYDAAMQVRELDLTPLRA